MTEPTADATPAGPPPAPRRGGLPVSVPMLGGLALFALGVGLLVGLRLAKSEKAAASKGGVEVVHLPCEECAKRQAATAALASVTPPPPAGGVAATTAPAASGAGTAEANGAAAAPDPGARFSPIAGAVTEG